MTQAGRGESQQKLDAEGMDAICDRIVEGQTYTAICASVGVSMGAFLAWLAADMERSQRARDSRIISAQAIDEQAQEAIRSAKDQFDLQKARELAVHLRWKASKIAPRDYGDKLQVEANVTHNNLSDDELQKRSAELATQLAAEQAALTPAIAPDEDES